MKIMENNVINRACFLYRTGSRITDLTIYFKFIVASLLTNSAFCCNI